MPAKRKYDTPLTPAERAARYRERKAGKALQPTPAEIAKRRFHAPEPVPLAPAPPLPPESEPVPEPPRAVHGEMDRCSCGCGFSWHDKFLAGLMTCPNIGTGCTAAGVFRSDALAHRKRFPAFARAWDGAIEDSVDLLENKLWAKAPNSPLLAKMFMQGYRRSIFGERQELLEATLLAALDYAKLSQMQLAMLAAGESVVKVLLSGPGEVQTVDDPDKPLAIEPGWPSREGRELEPRESDLIVSAETGGQDEGD